MAASEYLLMDHITDIERYELVIDRDNFCVVWDSTQGVYLVYDGAHASLWELEDQDAEEVLWATEFETRFGIYDGREQPHLLWEPEGTYETPNPKGEQSYRWHIVQGGEVLCHTATCSVRPYADSLTPISTMGSEERERKLGSQPDMSLCAHCAKHPLPAADQEEA